MKTKSIFGDRSTMLRVLTKLPLQMFKTKFFCVSMQKNGTTSCGDFMAHHGFKVARWDDAKKNKWTYKWQIGDYESIFKSIAFKYYQAFEDDPWWMPDFYRVLHRRFPKAKFILFYRDSDEWCYVAIPMAEMYCSSFKFVDTEVLCPGSKNSRVILFYISCLVTRSVPTII